MKKIIVTGATGFIGLHTCKSLVKSGRSVTAIIRPGSNTDLLASIGVAETIAADKIDDLAGDEFEGVINCAAAYGREHASFHELVEVNIGLPLRLLDWSIQSKIKSFIYLDTCFPITYPYLLPYTTSKKQMVQWGKLLPNDSELLFINLQLQHPFGPHDRQGKFIPWLIQECLQQKLIRLTDGLQQRDFIFVEDVADTILALLNNKQKVSLGFSEYQCGRGNAVSVRSMVEKIHEIIGSQSELQFGAIPNRPQEPFRLEANIDPLVDLDWEPKTPLDIGIRKTIESINSPNH